jgi:hypothetical protein
MMGFFQFLMECRSLCVYGHFVFALNFHLVFRWFFRRWRQRPCFSSFCVSPQNAS